MITNSIQQIINEHLKYMKMHDINSINFIYNNKHQISILMDHGVEIQITEVGEEYED